MWWRCRPGLYGCISVRIFSLACIVYGKIACIHVPCFCVLVHSVQYRVKVCRGPEAECHFVTPLGNRIHFFSCHLAVFGRDYRLVLKTIYISAICEASRLRGPVPITPHLPRGYSGTDHFIWYDGCLLCAVYTCIEYEIMVWLPIMTSVHEASDQ